MTNIIRDWNGFTIRQREDGYLSATDMCKACGKLFGHWNVLNSTKEYLKALQEEYYRDHDNTPLVESSSGNLGEKSGTWVHRHVALELARWLSPQFAIQCNKWVEELMLKGYVSIRDNNAYKIALDVEQAVKTISDIENSHPIVYKLAMDSLGIDMRQKLNIDPNINQFMLDSSLTANRLGLAFNKHLKAFQLLDDIKQSDIENLTQSAINAAAERRDYFSSLVDNLMGKCKEIMQNSNEIAEVNDKLKKINRRILNDQDKLQEKYDELYRQYQKLEQEYLKYTQKYNENNCYSSYKRLLSGE